jgi:hypothetical protein
LCFPFVSPLFQATLATLTDGREWHVRAILGDAILAKVANKG